MSERRTASEWVNAFRRQRCRVSGVDEKKEKTVIDSESSRASEKICSINKKESGNPMNRQKPDRSIDLNFQIKFIE